MVATYSYIQAYVFIHSQCWTYSCMHAVGFYGNQLASQIACYSYIAIVSQPGRAICMQATGWTSCSHILNWSSVVSYLLYTAVQLYILNEYQLCSQLCQSVVLKICDCTDASWLQSKSLATYITSCQLQLCMHRITDETSNHV